jgi:hypothetical protein
MMMSEQAAQPDEVAPDHAPAADAANNPPHASHSRLRAIFFMLVGAGVGLGCALFVPEYFNTFQLPDDLAKKQMNAQTLRPEDQVKLDAATKELNQRNGAVTYGLLGGILGAAFGTLSMLLYRPGLFPVGLILGALFGAGGGAAAGYASAFAYHFALANHRDFVGPIAHAAAFSILGVGLGVAFAATSGGFRSLPGYILAGVLSGFLAALIFHPVMARFLPVHNVDMIVPVELAPQLLWTAIPAALFGLFLGGRPVSRPTSPPEA